MKNLALLIIIAFVSIGFSARGAESVPCSVSEGQGDAAMMACYRKDYHERYEINQQRTKELVAKAKAQIEAASDAGRKSRMSAYMNLLRQVNLAVSHARRQAANTCVRMASKFESPVTSVLAATNCRTSLEVELDHELRRLENRMHVLNALP